MSFGHNALRSPSQMEIPLIWNFHTEHTILLKYSSADPCWGTGSVQPLAEVRIHICFLEYKPRKQNIWPRASCVVKQVLGWFLLHHELIAHIWKLLSQFHWFLVVLLWKRTRTVPLSPLWFLAWTEAGLRPLPQCLRYRKNAALSLIPLLCLLSRAALPFSELWKSLFRSRN